jgi:hypothetical protein
MGMGFPLSTPALHAGLVVVTASWSQSDGSEATGKNRMAGAPKHSRTRQIPLGGNELALVPCRPACGEVGSVRGSFKRLIPVEPRDYGAFAGLYWWYVYFELELGPVLTAI